MTQLRTAVGSLMSAISLLSPNAVTAAPTHYGEDFRITPGAARWQLRMARQRDYHRATVQYPRVEVTILIHHYVTNYANEEEFLHQTMYAVGTSLLDPAIWGAEANVFGLEPDVETEIGEGSREGNVITFEVVAMVLMDPE
jgi:hypothetical protein